MFGLTEADRADFLAHMLRLDGPSRYRRFGVALSDEGVVRVCRQLPLDNCAWGMYVWGQLKGSSMVVPCPGNPSRGELAIALLPSLRGRGWGTRLTETALQAAYMTGKTHVEVNYIAENTAMARICSKFPGPCERNMSDYQKTVDLEAWMDDTLMLVL